MGSVDVSAAFDLVDASDASLSVPKGTMGSVVATSGPVSALRYHVDFDTSTGTVTRWVMPNEVVFLDGALGPVRAYYEASGLTITSIDHLAADADFDQQLGGPVGGAGAVVFTFSDGTKLTVTADRNVGSVVFDLT